MQVTCEQVSRGHVDKICDQIADAIVTDCLKHDKNSRVAIECLFKGTMFVIAGELTSEYEPDYSELVCEVFKRIGLKHLLDDMLIIPVISKQSPDIALGVDKGGAGDQGIMYGYATNETAELLPIPFAVATKFVSLLEHADVWWMKPDAKAQVTYDYSTGKITTFVCSVQHSECVTAEEMRPVIEGYMLVAAGEYMLNTDFEKLINPTGAFVVGGSEADTGVTGRKLACDTYGGVGHIGGGALSGKDPTKVDRAGAYMARKIAADIVDAEWADRCEVQIAYAIGKAEPVSVTVETFGTEHVCPHCLDEFVMKHYDLTPQGIIKNLGLLDVDYNRVSSGGHFGKGMPWETTDDQSPKCTFPE